MGRARGGTVAVVVVLLCVAACGLRWRGSVRMREACLATRAGEPLAQLDARLARVGARFVGLAGEEHQWLRVRWFALRHDACFVRFDADERAVSARYDHTWDLL